MFKDKEFDHLKKMSNSMADGLTDASESHQVLETIVGILSETDFTSEYSRMELMMKVVNLCYDEDDEEEMSEDKVIAVILALCFNYANVMSNLVADGFNVDEYYEFLVKEVLPVMREESKALPYWEIDE